MFLNIIFIGIGLAMDCFAVSLSAGLKVNKNRIKQAIKISFLFGFFQAIMPSIGFFVGALLKTYIIKIDHWIAFFILGSIGLKMIFEAKSKEQSQIDFNNNRLIILLSLATSIDSLITGVSFVFMNTPLIMSVIIIGFVTFIISLVGFFIGGKMKFITKEKANIVGGVALLIIGFKILVSHLTAIP
jgi:manganese efflux pump family protein